MLSLPVELRLQTIRHIRDSIPSPLFEDDAPGSIRAIEALYQILVALSLYHREWTAIAQSELLRHLYIRDAGKLKLLLKLLRAEGVFRGYTTHSLSALLGQENNYWRCAGGLGDEHLGELADYCHHLGEISCYHLHIPLMRFRTS
jgi:hypothetical protein